MWFNNGPKEVFAINESWSESDITWENAPEMGEAISTNSNTGLWGWEEFDVTSDLQKVFAGEKENNGWYVTHSTTSFGAFWRSSEYKEAAERPKLSITYSGGTVGIQQTVNKPNVNFDQAVVVEIVNLQGKVVSSYRTKDISSYPQCLSKGTYILRVTNQTKPFVKKFVIQ